MTRDAGIGGIVLNGTGTGSGIAGPATAAVNAGIGVLLNAGLIGPAFAGVGHHLSVGNGGAAATVGITSAVMGIVIELGTLRRLTE